MAKGEIIVSMDADTLIKEDTIPLLVRRFQDDKVAAVSGNVKVGNVRNRIILWQHVEYITGFNLERRAFDDLNHMPVVPGIIGPGEKKPLKKFSSTIPRLRTPTSRSPCCAMDTKWSLKCWHWLTRKLPKT